MAATGYTPIYLYYSSTATNQPSAGNLGYGELAINITDKNLFFKDNTNSVNAVPLRQASGSSNGWLSSTDWTTFNNKQAALVSGTNIKTVGGVDLLGSGDISAFTENITVNTVQVGRGGGGVITNIAYGAQAMAGSSTAAGGNSAVGYATLYGVTTGIGNTGIGYFACYGVQDGTSNTGVGFQALFTNPSGAYNTAVGRDVLYNCTGSFNTSVGFQSLVAVNSGTYNTALGMYAGNNITTGSHNINIGLSTQASAVSVNNEIVIGDQITGKGTNTAYIGGSSGAYNGANTTTWATTSDKNIKKNIIDNNDGLNKILTIRVRNFEYRLPEEIELPLDKSAAINKQGVQLGVIAQEFLPECVKQESTGVMTVDNSPVIWYLVNAVKELNDKIDKLTKIV